MCLIFQGKVEIIYGSKLILVGHAVDGTLAGPQRYFMQTGNDLRLNTINSDSQQLILMKDKNGWKVKLSKNKVYIQTSSAKSDFVCDGGMEDKYHLNCRNVKTGAQVMPKNTLQPGVWSSVIEDGDDQFAYNTVIDERQSSPSQRVHCPDSLRQALFLNKLL